jgi:NSS family neurotransmitter:Na+ symporter
MQQSSSSQERWRSPFAFVMAAVGAAVGLGNIWKFPYMAGANGGSAFVIFYLLCVLLIGIPTMMGEVLIGRLGRKNPLDSLKHLAQQHQASLWWMGISLLGMLSLLMVLSFYSVVAGWSLAYMSYSLLGWFNHATPEHVAAIWTQLLNSPWALLGWHSTFILMTMLVVARGVEKGIESASRILMPGLFVILLLLVIYSAWFGEFSQALHFLFDFELSKLTPAVMVAAMGQAFFTLALGAGALLVYGAYLPQQTRIGHSIAMVAILDTLVALLAGLAIFPIVFRYHFEPAAGEGLMYQILPLTFSTLPGGQWVGCLFFLLLVLAAWTSTFSLAEPMVLTLMEKFKITRSKASIQIGFLAWLLGIGALLSFNHLHAFKLLFNWSIFETLVTLPTQIFLPLGGLGFALFAGWVVPAHDAQAGLQMRSKLLFQSWRFLIRYVVPFAIFIIFINLMMALFKA